LFNVGYVSCHKCDVWLQVTWTATARPLEKATDIAGFYLKTGVIVYTLSVAL